MNLTAKLKWQFEILWRILIMKYYFIKSRLVDENKSEFIPHLECGGEKFGTIGEKADFTALFGEELYVGDTVEIYCTTSNIKGRKCIVCKYGNCGFFVMGLGNRFKCGVSDIWQIRKSNSYKELKHGQKIDGVIAILQ